MFDYCGFGKEKLLALCNEKFVYRGLADWKYWPSEVYSFGNHVRDYSFYPKILPLYIYSNHGFTGDYKELGLPQHEADNDAECMFCLNPENTQYYIEKTAKKAHSMYSSFVWYRRKNKIEQIESSSGTLAFPAHSTPNIDLASSTEEYIKQLKQLPEEFQPVCVCLHMHDINKGQHELFLEHGIPVYTAGNAFDYRFAERFYGILKNFKYATSNLVGSYTFYSVEMGIPFSLYGDQPILINNSDLNLKKGEYKFQETESYINYSSLFAGLNKSINNEQKIFVERNLGIYDGLSRWKMAKVLYGAYLKRGHLVKDLLFAVNAIRKYLKSKIKEAKYEN